MSAYRKIAKGRKGAKESPTGTALVSSARPLVLGTAWPAPPRPACARLFFSLAPPAVRGMPEPHVRNCERAGCPAAGGTSEQFRRAKRATLGRASGAARVVPRYRLAGHRGRFEKQTCLERGARRLAT